MKRRFRLAAVLVQVLMAGLSSGCSLISTNYTEDGSTKTILVRYCLTFTASKTQVSPGESFTVTLTAGSGEDCDVPTGPFTLHYGYGFSGPASMKAGDTVSVQAISSGQIDLDSNAITYTASGSVINSRVDVFGGGEYTKSSGGSVDVQIALGESFLTPFVKSEVAIEEPSIWLYGKSLPFAATKVSMVQPLGRDIMNRGKGDLTVSSVTVDNSASEQNFVLDRCDVGPPTLLKQNYSFNCRVFFIPRSPGAKTGTMTITSNDPKFPEIKVTLFGQGTE